MRLKINRAKDEYYIYLQMKEIDVNKTPDSNVSRGALR